LRLPLSDDNPFPPGRYAFAWEHVPAGASVLDYGCFDGEVLAQLRRDGRSRRIGVDLNHEAVAGGLAKHPGLDLRCIRRSEPLDLPDAAFDRVLLLDVLEHVVDQRGLLAELRRVLKSDGELIVTVPGQHLFSFLDFGNWKFYAPGIHRWWYVGRHGRQEYEYRYGVANPFGLIGDIEIGKKRHEHFTRRGLRHLLEAAGFQAVGFDGTGFFQRLIGLLSKGVPVQRLWRPLLRRDALAFEKTNLFCLAAPARPSAAP
jgi:SAM-dependent methyltransferase